MRQVGANISAQVKIDVSSNFGTHPIRSALHHQRILCLAFSETGDNATISPRQDWAVLGNGVSNVLL